MAGLTKFLALCGVLMLAACGVETGPINQKVSTWQLADVSVRYGPEIGRTATGLDYDSNFVWNGYSQGNRKKQVLGLFRAALGDLAGEAMTGTRPVKMNVQINYFHALTDFSRLFCCGEHRIYADLNVVDQQTNAVLASENNVYLGRIALGGIPGLVAVAIGRDQPVRVREGIAFRTRDWLKKW